MDDNIKTTQELQDTTNYAIEREKKKAFKTNLSILAYHLR